TAHRKIAEARGGLTTHGALGHWKPGHCLGSVGGPKRCPGTFFIGFFEFGQGHRAPP
ncbi:unnamed protein product, partial [Staurois parvus]